jgi:hypothetical protein
LLNVSAGKLTPKAQHVFDSVSYFIQPHKPNKKHKQTKQKQKQKKQNNKKKTSSKPKRLAALEVAVKLVRTKCNNSQQSQNFELIKFDLTNTAQNILVNDTNNNHTLMHNIRSLCR